MSWHMLGRYPASRTASALPRAASFLIPSFQYIIYYRSGLECSLSEIMSIERPRTLPLQDSALVGLEAVGLELDSP
jgi:hypothetical protein